MKELLKKFIPWIDIDKKIYRKYLKSSKLYRSGKKRLANYLSYQIQKKYHCIISPHSMIGSNLKLPHPLSIVIGYDAIIGNSVTIYQDVTIGQKDNKYPTIGNNVMIYTGAKIIGDVHIGNNVIIGANAVVMHDVPDNCVVAGIPARIIKRNDE